MLLFFFALERIFCWFLGGFTRSMCTMGLKRMSDVYLSCNMILVAKGVQGSYRRLKSS